MTEVQNSSIIYQYVREYARELLPFEFELYLVGSRASNTANTKSDYDFILLIKEESQVNNLPAISNRINGFVSQTNSSVKVFDVPSFENLTQEDYFRFYEYKNTLGNDWGMHNKDVLQGNELNDEFLYKNFVNSIVIQSCWSICSILMNRVHQDYISQKLRARFYRNLMILNSLLESSRSESFMAEKVLNDELYTKMMDMKNPHSKDFLLDKYFQRFVHERINKERYYRTVLSSCPQQISMVSAQLNINKIITQ